MKIQIQWTVDPPADWQWIDSADWSTLPSKPEPTGGEIIDDKPGWIYALNVQGVLFFADHYMVIHGSDSISVTVWNDDPEDFSPDQYFGSIWTFYAPVFENGEYNTRQQLKRYGSVFPDVPAITTGGEVERNDWISFSKPVVNSLIRHGIWVPDEMLPVYDAFQPANWQDWIEA